MTVATLVAVFADHHPGSPAASVCPACGYRYPERVTDCPTNTVARPLLYRRRGEDRQALTRLTDDQYADLFDRKTARRNRVAAGQAAQPNGGPGHGSPALFDLTSGTGSMS